MKTEPEDIDELDLFLREKQMAGLWHVKEEERPFGGKTPTLRGLCPGIRQPSNRRPYPADAFLLDADASPWNENSDSPPHEHQHLPRLSRQRDHRDQRRAFPLGKGGHVRCPPLELARARQPILKRRCHPVLDERCACPQTLRPLP